VERFGVDVQLGLRKLIYEPRTSTADDDILLRDWRHLTLLLGPRKVREVLRSSCLWMYIALAYLNLNMSSAVAEMGDRCHNRHGPKKGSCCSARLAGPRLTQCGLDSYFRASSSIQQFGHNRHEPKTGGCAPFRGKLRPHLTPRRLSRGLPRTKWHLDPSSHLATTDIGRKLGAVPLEGRGARSLSNTSRLG